MTIFSGYPSNSSFLKRYKSSFNLRNTNSELPTANNKFLHRIEVLFLEYVSLHFYLSISINNNRKKESLKQTHRLQQRMVGIDSWSYQARLNSLLRALGTWDYEMSLNFKKAMKQELQLPQALSFPLTTRITNGELPHHCCLYLQKVK